MDIRKLATFVINLDKNTSRLETVKRDFSTLGVPITRFPAVYAKTLDKSYLDSVVHPYVWYTIDNGQTADPDIQSIGAVGCSLSHIQLWKQLLQEPAHDEVYHIVEDDAIPKTSIDKMNAFVKEVQQLDPDWDVIYLGYNWRYVYAKPQTKVNSRVQKISAPSFGTHSYLVRKKGAEKLLKHAFPIYHHVDNYMSTMASHGGVRAYRPQKSMIDQSLAAISDIGSLSNYKTSITRLPKEALLTMLLLSIFVVVYFFVKAVSKIRSKR